MSNSSYTAQLTIHNCMCHTLGLIGYFRPLEKDISPFIVPAAILQMCYTYLDRCVGHKDKCPGKQIYGSMSHELLSKFTNDHKREIPSLFTFKFKPEQLPNMRWQSFKFGDAVISESGIFKIIYTLESLNSNPACVYIGFVTKINKYPGFDYNEPLGSGDNQRNSMGIYINHASVSVIQNGEYKYAFKKLSSSGFDIAKKYDSFMLKFDLNKSKCRLFYNGKKVKGKWNLNQEELDVIIPAVSLYYPGQKIRVEVQT